MAPSQPPKGRSHKVKKARRSQLKSNPKSPTPTQLVNEATAFLHTGDPEAALPLALRALVLTQTSPIFIPAAQPHSNPIPATPARESLPALKILAEINLELGDAEAARAYFLQAVDVDPAGEVVEDEGGGAEKFLWLAQLCEEGGEESVRWFERGAEVLRRDIAVAEQKGGDGEGLEDKRKKLARALCGIIEVYMTDLSYVFGDPLRLMSSCHCFFRVSHDISLPFPIISYRPRILINLQSTVSTPPPNPNARHSSPLP